MSNTSRNQPDLTFIVSTVKDRGKVNGQHISFINSHCAYLQHARSRGNKQRSATQGSDVRLVISSANVTAVRRNRNRNEQCDNQSSSNRMDQSILVSENIRTQGQTQQNERSVGRREAATSSASSYSMKRIYDMTSSLSLRPNPLNCWVVASPRLSTLGVLQVYHHCINVYWTGFIPSSGKAIHLPPWVDSWADFESQGQGVFYSNMWQSAINLSFQSGLPVNDPEVLKYYSALLNYVSAGIASRVDKVSDDVLWAITGLTVPDVPVYDRVLNAKTVFRSPFPDIMWTSVFSRYSISNGHMRAIYRILELQGGIDSLTADGLPQALNNMDLIYSTQALERPRLSPNKIFRTVGAVHDRHNHFGHDLNMAVDIATLDSDDLFIINVEFLIQQGLSENLVELMHDLHTWTKVLQAYCDERIQRPDFALLAVHRSLFQHRILSALPEKGIIPVGVGETRTLATLPTINSLTLLALCIFSVCVTFPINDRTPCKALANQLRTQLRYVMRSLIDLDLIDFVTWLCMLGALAGEHVSDDTLAKWFGHRLCCIESLLDARRRSSPLKGASVDAANSRTWMQVKDMSLKPLLWCDYACDAGGEAVWNNLMRSRMPSGLTEEMAHG